MKLPMHHLLAEDAGDERGAADVHVSLAAQPQDAVLGDAPHGHPPRVVKQRQRVRPAQSQLRAGWWRGLGRCSAAKQVTATAGLASAMVAYRPGNHRCLLDLLELSRERSIAPGSLRQIRNCGQWEIPMQKGSSL